MNRIRAEFFFILFILIITTFFVSDLFLHKGQPATFDGPTHISNIAQMYGGLKDGEFPVQWGQGFARYGMPIPLFAQQVTSYLGGFINLVTQNVILSYNFVVVIGAFVSTLFMYYFLRLYVGQLPAFTAAILFHFAPYRIMNVYIRGALPEFFSSIFTILVLISLYYALDKEKLWGYLLLIISLALLLLTHPFMVVVSSIIFIPYALYLLSKKKRKITPVIPLAVSGIAALGIAAYYIVPLFLEIKYFFYGQSTDHFVNGHFLSLEHFYSENWYYFLNDVATRAHWHLGGVIESLVIIFAIGFGIGMFMKQKKIELIHVFIFSGILYLFFLLPISEFLYKNITLLGNIQHPWRMLSGYILIAPILLALSLKDFKYNAVVLVLIISLIAVFRFPQLYGKNYTEFPQKSYFVTEDNLHGEVMHTLWMGKVREYPYKNVKAEIIEGKGTILEQDVKNSKRTYQINADSDLRMVDNTFYFPGWKAYVDGGEVPIEFQDLNYRGMITYRVPAGTHEVKVVFTDTKIRLLGKVISILSIIFLTSLIILYKKKIIIQPLFKKYIT